MGVVILLAEPTRRTMLRPFWRGKQATVGVWAEGLHRGHAEKVQEVWPTRMVSEPSEYSA